jgi:hypothetical protein
MENGNLWNIYLKRNWEVGYGSYFLMVIARLILINSILTILPMLKLFFSKYPKGKETFGFL